MLYFRFLKSPCDLFKTSSEADVLPTRLRTLISTRYEWLNGDAFTDGAPTAQLKVNGQARLSRSWRPLKLWQIFIRKGH